MKTNIIIEELLRKQYVGKHVSISNGIHPCVRHDIICVSDVEVSTSNVPVFYAHGPTFFFHNPLTITVVERRREVYKRWHNELYYDYVEELYKATFYKSRTVCDEKRNRNYVWFYTRESKSDVRRRDSRYNVYFTWLKELSLYYRFRSLPYTPRP